MKISTKKITNKTINVACGLLLSVASMSMTYAQQPPYNCNNLPVYTGEGTYYGATGEGHCSFNATPNDLNVAALNNPQYNSAIFCGGCAVATGPKGTVQVRIVDECPECKHGDLDFSLQAFTQIADQVAGRVPISWRLTTCPVQGNIKYRYKEGSSQWWCAVQIRNHRYPIWKLEYRKPNGTYVEMPRQTYNYFLAPSGIDEDKSQAGPYHFRVTDIFGQVIEESGIPFIANGEANSAQQFPICQAVSVEPTQYVGVRVLNNPFTEYFQIKMEQAHQADILVTDINGRIVIQTQTDAQSEIRLGQDLPAGVYYLQVNTAHGRFATKVLKLAY